MRKHIQIVLPVYNELQSIAPLIKALDEAAISLNGNYRVSYLFVNDGSTDGSREVIQTLCAQRDDVRAVHLIHNFGHAAAIRCGLAHAEADAVVLMDTDLQDTPDALERMVASWSEGAKTVVALRGKREGGRQWAFKFFYYLLARLAPGQLQFGTYCLLDRQVVARLLAIRENSRYFPALVSFASGPIATVVVDRKARTHGKSRVGELGLLNLAVTAYLNASDLPVRFATFVGIACCLGSFITFMFAVGASLVAQVTLPGWFIVVATIWFVGGVQLLSIGILGEYIARIFREVKQRPPYFVESIDHSRQKRIAA